MPTTMDPSNFSGISYILIIIAFVLAASLFIFIISHYFAKHVLIKFINKRYRKKPAGFGMMLYKNHVFYRIAYLIPGIILYCFADYFDIHYHDFHIYLAGLITPLTIIYMLIVGALVISSILNCIQDHYSNLKIAKQKPIKSYLQVTKIVLFIITGVFVASTLFEKSPTYFLTGVGAATAIIVLVFKDSILGFVASIQLAAYDMVRIGDWIEMPNFGADGEVIDISLNTIKVQNFDKTIVTIPSYALLSTGIKNWRGMKEAGGRRVKRSINIDITSIKICDAKLLARLSHLELIHHKIERLLKNDEQEMTNLGLLRLYLEKYLKQHHHVHKHMKIIIRHLQATATGLPLELYFFTTEIDSEKYEAIQADIFEYVYAMLPTFNLRAFQNSGYSD